MRTRPLRSALVLSAAIAAVVLATTPSSSTAVAVTQGAPHSSPESIDSSGPIGDPTVARIDQRDSTVERALKHRDVLLAVGVALVALAALLRRDAALALTCERNGTAAPSPFCGRAPPAVHALCT